MNMKETFELFAAIAGLVATIPIYKGWLQGALYWNRRRKLEKLTKERSFLERLQNSDRELIGWLLHQVLLVITLFSIALMFRSIEIDQEGAKLVAVLHWVIGGFAYFVAVNALGTYHRLQHYDTTRSKLDEKIRALTK